MTTRLRIKVIDSDVSIQKKMTNHMASQLTRVLFKVRPLIQRDVQKNLLTMFKESLVYKSLTAGALAAHFGFPEGTEHDIVDTIIEELQEQIFVNIKRFSKDLITGVEVSIYKTGFVKILQLKEAYVLTEEEEELPWLQWLLLEGDRIIISDYRIFFHSKVRKWSRSGQAIMVPGGSWKVPGYLYGERISGTVNDNWITRTITNIRPIIDQIIVRNLKKVL